MVYALSCFSSCTIPLTTKPPTSPSHFNPFTLSCIIRSTVILFFLPTQNRISCPLSPWTIWDSVSDKPAAPWHWLSSQGTESTVQLDLSAVIGSHGVWCKQQSQRRAGGDLQHLSMCGCLFLCCTDAGYAVGIGTPCDLMDQSIPDTHKWAASIKTNLQTVRVINFWVGRSSLKWDCFQQQQSLLTDLWLLREDLLISWGSCWLGWEHHVSPLPRESSAYAWSPLLPKIPFSKHCLHNFLVSTVAMLWEAQVPVLIGISLGVFTYCSSELLMRLL